MAKLRIARDVLERTKKRSNLTRLAKILHPAGEVTLAQMRDVLRYGCA
jgi:hypothetical protein